jgi:hypothetical protein
MNVNWHQASAAIPMVCGVILLLGALKARRFQVPSWTALGMLGIAALLYGVLVVVMESRTIKEQASLQFQLYHIKTVIGGIGIGAILHSMLSGTFKFRKSHIEPQE